MIGKLNAASNVERNERNLRMQVCSWRSRAGVDIYKGVSRFSSPHFTGLRFWVGCWVEAGLALIIIRTQTGLKAIKARRLLPAFVILSQFINFQRVRLTNKSIKLSHDDSVDWDTKTPIKAEESTSRRPHFRQTSASLMLIETQKQSSNHQPSPLASRFTSNKSHTNPARTS